MNSCGRLSYGIIKGARKVSTHARARCQAWEHLCGAKRNTKAFPKVIYSGVMREGEDVRASEAPSHLSADERKRAILFVFA